MAKETKMGSNHANLFVDFAEEQTYELYTGPLPDNLVGTLLTVLAHHHVLVLSWRS